MYYDGQRHDRSDALPGASRENGYWWSFNQVVDIVSAMEQPIKFYKMILEYQEQKIILKRNGL